MIIKATTEIGSAQFQEFEIVFEDGMVFNGFNLEENNNGKIVLINRTNNLRAIYKRLKKNTVKMVNLTVKSANQIYAGQIIFDCIDFIEDCSWEQFIVPEINIIYR